MTKVPSVSIVLPTYNGSKYLQASIDSCLAQTFADFELIIVDDSSTDKTPEIIKCYKDPRIRYHRNEVNQRLPRSLNIGFSLARGEYLTWTSDDNFYLPDAIEKMLRCLNEKGGEFVYADIYALQGDDVPGAKHEKLPDCEKLVDANCVRACFLYTRKAMVTIGDYDPDMELIEDYDYWVRIWEKFHLHHISEPLYYYRYHPQALWSRHFAESPIREYLFKWKYNFMTREKVNWHLRELRSRELKGFRKFRVKLFDRIFTSNQINTILETYKEGKCTFIEARKKLQAILCDAMPKD